MSSVFDLCTHCGHAKGAHDIFELGDPYPTCCVGTCQCGQPGEAIITRGDDNTLTVTHADPVIRVTNSLLESTLLPGIYDPETEVLTLDTAGEYRYGYLRPDPRDHRISLFGRLADD